MRKENPAAQILIRAPGNELVVRGNRAAVQHTMTENINLCASNDLIMFQATDNDNDEQEEELIELLVDLAKEGRFKDDEDTPLPPKTFTEVRNMNKQILGENQEICEYKQTHVTDFFQTREMKNLVVT